MRRRRTSVRRLLRPLGLSVGALLYALFIFIPLIWIVSSSFLPEASLVSPTFSFSGGGFTTSNYEYIFTGRTPRERGDLHTRITQEVREIPRAILNSLTVSAGAALLSLLIGGMAAYAFTFHKFKRQEGIFTFLLLSRILPPVTIVIPIFIIARSAGLYDSRLGLMIVYTSFILPIAILFYRSYLSRIPREVCEAALIDGCSEWAMAFRVIFPVAKGGIVAGCLFTFFLAYIDFLFALILTRSPGSKTMPVVLGAMAGNPDLSYVLLCAGVALAIVPSVIIGLVVRKYLVGGIIHYEKS